MRIFTKQSVLDAAKDRINYIFDEFEFVAVSFSGGKDSTTVLNLALQIANERNRLPLPVIFVDQEAEWNCAIDYVRYVMDDERVKPFWFQMPIRISNGTSIDNPWLYCWEDGAEWIRPKEPNSIHNNRFGSKTFHDLFGLILDDIAEGRKAAYLAGVRAEESPARTIGLTSQATYKAVTWGKILNRNRDQYTFYPLYDWSYTDIWKAIESHKWRYCRLYDFMYQYGIKTNDMRLSNVHHETAIRALYIMQEIEPENWNAIQRRLKGVNTAAQLKNECFARPKELPYMFSDWREYRDHLLNNLITDQEAQNKFRTKFTQMDARYRDMNSIESMYKAQVDALVVNDYHMTKLTNWERNPDVNTWRIWKKTGKIRTDGLKNKYIGI